MPGTLKWYEGSNAQNADGTYPGDESGVLDVQRIVGDLGHGRVFRDPSGVEPGTNPSKSEVLTTLSRAESTIATWLATGDYVAVTPASGAANLDAFRTLLELRAQLASFRLMTARPVTNRDTVIQDEDTDSRSLGLAYDIRSTRKSIETGQFPMPKHSAARSITVGAPPSRDPTFTFDLEL